jgi:aspartyl-tRNA(Asn)/glutamyl-tRNA(Gln) amidotransferase subunit B
VGFDLAEGLVASGRDDLFKRVPGDRRAVANVIMNQLAATGVAPDKVDATELGKLVEARERIPRAAFDEAIARVGQAGFSADPYLAEESVSDEAALAPIVERIVAANPAQVEQYRNGKDGLLGFFVGQVMKETQGKADPKVVNELLRRVLAV